MTKRSLLSFAALAVAAAAAAYYQFGDVAAEAPVLNSAEATRGAVVPTVEATGRLEAVTIETARADDVVRVPNAALRFRPSEEIFAALGQTLPVRRGGGPR